MRRAENTLYIVAYDIPADRRRTKVHKLLCGYGTWTQYSLFECWLTKQHLIELRAKLKAIIDHEDSVRFYPLCKACVANVATEGSPKPEDKQTIIL